MLKTRLILILLTVLILPFKVIAKPGNMQLASTGTSPEGNMTWPMLPGESLNELAVKFYPKNKKMQLQFVAKVQYLMQESLPNLTPDDHFKAPTAIVIPTLTPLSATIIKPIKKAAIQPKKGRLRLSYNIQTELKRIPKQLLIDYERLVVRNEFLKKEIALIKNKVVSLKKELGNLTQLFHKMLSLPKKKDIKTKAVKKLEKKMVIKQATAAPITTQQKEASFLDFSSSLLNRNLGLGILLLGLLSFLALLFKRSRVRKENEFINEAPQQVHAIKFDDDLEQKTTLEEAFSVTELKEDTTIEEETQYSTIDRAKVLVNKNALEEAIEYLKLTLKDEPKSAINIWLYLLGLLRKQNLKEDFEKFAADMHDAFNVMTPLWEQRAVAIVVPESLEEFPHIIEKLTKTWPKDSARTYLTELVTDNRNGERTGFGQSVVDEILFLIHVLDKRTGYWEVQGSI